MAHEFWLSDRQWAAIEPYLPRNRQEVEPGIIGGRVEGHWLAVMGLPHRIVSSWVMIVPCKFDGDVRRVTALQRPQRPG
jgi:hypothetical protein